LWVGKITWRVQNCRERESEINKGVFLYYSIVSVLTTGYLTIYMIYDMMLVRVYVGNGRYSAVKL
jgi:hypothetical protein